MNFELWKIIKHFLLYFKPCIMHIENIIINLLWYETVLEILCMKKCSKKILGFVVLMFWYNDGSSLIGYFCDLASFRSSLALVSYVVHKISNKKCICWIRIHYTTVVKYSVEIYNSYVRTTFVCPPTLLFCDKTQMP